MTNGGQRVSLETHYAISQHYFAEAALLQERKFSEWLETMVAEDIHYWMPIYELRFAKDRRPEPTPDDAAIFNERYDDLKMRVGQLHSGLVWMEDPPSRIRYYINNLEAFDIGDGAYETRCNIFVQRHRRQDEVTQHSLGREDLLRRDGDGFRVSKRKIIMDARVVQDKNLYFFV